MENRDIPPIASPFGDSKPSEHQGKANPDAPQGISVTYGSMLSWRTVGRKTAKAMCLIPTCVLFELVALPVWPFSFLVAFLVNYAVLKPRGPTTNILNRAGLHETAKPLGFTISWKRFLWMVEWGGDVCFSTIGGGCFIPREAFSSRDEAREFVRIARELKQSNGAAWRDEWNGRVFGA